MTELSKVKVPDDCSYIAAFLTLQCNYNCRYCLTMIPRGDVCYRCHIPHELSAEQWIVGLSRLEIPRKNSFDLPITLCGGEPTLHTGFYDIIAGLPERIRVDILTNLSFKIDDLYSKIKPYRLMRRSPVHVDTLRATYHPTEIDVISFLNKASELRLKGYPLACFGILFPETAKEVIYAQARARDNGLKFYTKEYLGIYESQLYGEYYDRPACTRTLAAHHVNCRTSEILIGPDGNIYRCHRDLYRHEGEIGNILEPDLKIDARWRDCENHGDCNFCDMKIKTNYMLEKGFRSTELLKK